MDFSSSEHPSHLDAYSIEWAGERTPPSVTCAAIAICAANGVKIGAPTSSGGSRLGYASDQVSQARDKGSIGRDRCPCSPSSERSSHHAIDRAAARPCPHPARAGGRPPPRGGDLPGDPDPPAGGAPRSIRGGRGWGPPAPTP